MTDTYYVFTRRVPDDKIEEVRTREATELPVAVKGYSEGGGRMYSCGPFSRKHLESLYSDYWTSFPPVKEEDIIEP